MAIEGYDLFDRGFAANPFDSTHPDYPSFRIGGHMMDAVLVDYAEGASSRAQIITALELGTEAITDLDVILAEIDAAGTVVGKLRFAANFGAVVVIAQAGLRYTTKSEFKTRLGL